MSEITSLINDVGFPIFAVIVLFWQNNEMRKMFDNEQKDLQKTITDNTLVLTKLSVSIDEALGNKKGDDENEPTK